MLESKKKMAQSFSDLKVATEKGKGNPWEFFSVFKQGCREFTQETLKLPPEVAGRFLDAVERLGRNLQSGDESAVRQGMEEIKQMKKTCHETYK
jgi:XXXCH domain-containing protein